MKVACAIAALLVAASAQGSALRGADDTQRDLAIGIKGVNNGKILFGPSTKAADQIVVACPALNQYISTIQICAKKWVRGVYGIGCISTADAADPSYEVFVTAPNDGSAGTCVAGDPYIITVTSTDASGTLVGFNGASGLFARTFPEEAAVPGTKFSSGVSFHSPLPNMPGTAHVNGFSELIGARISELKTVNVDCTNSSLKKLGLPDAKNTVVGTNGTLQSNEYGWCGVPGTKITQLLLWVAGGHDESDSGFLPFISGFGVTCALRK